MTLSLPCSIKNCHRYVAVELTDADGKNLHETNGIALCNVCEALIVVETQIRMARDGVFGARDDVAHHFTVLFNQWRRQRKGVTFMHAPEVVNIGVSPEGN